MLVELIVIDMFVLVVNAYVFGSMFVYLSVVSHILDREYFAVKHDFSS